MLQEKKQNEKEIQKTGKEGKQYLIRQAELHPAMQPQDVYKFLFQAAFGAEHLLQDREAAYSYFQKEYANTPPEEALLYEQISDRVCRVNIAAWKKRNLPADWLFRMFADSAEAWEQREEKKFLQYFAEAVELAEEGIFGFSKEAFLLFTENRGEDFPGNPQPVHHSEEYRRLEKPAYRLVDTGYFRLLPILEAMAGMRGETEEDGTVRVIAIDGRCASGKTTMAGLLSEITGAGVVHMDDFFLPMELRTKERLSEPGGNVHYERFQAEVLPWLGEREGFSYQCFDCRRMELGEKRTVKNTFFRIVEGAYSCHPVFGRYADLQIFSDVEPAKQLTRIRKRDGEAALSVFRERWIPMEERYFAAYGVRESADLVV